jgi:hypothetical protein
MATDNSSTDLAEFSAWMKAHKFDLDSTDVDAGADLFRAFKAGAGKSVAAAALDVDELEDLLYVHNPADLRALFAAGLLDEISADGKTIPADEITALIGILEARNVQFDITDDERELCLVPLGVSALQIRRIRETAIADLRRERRAKLPLGIEVF